MGILIGIGLLQLAILLRISYQLELTPKGEWLRESLQVMLAEIRDRRSSN